MHSALIYTVMIECSCVCTVPTEVGISPHCNTTSLVMRPYVFT